MKSVVRDDREHPRCITIGIVTISFNQAQFLEEAIETVTMSDPSRLRYVIVDPGSKDGSRDIIEKHSARFSKILLDKDKGPTDGLNKGFAACDADIMGYLNSDDRFVPGALDWVLKYFEENPDVDIILGSVYWLDKEGNRQRRKRISMGVTLVDFLDETQLYLQQATFFRKSLFEAVGGFDLDNRTSWDTVLVVKMLMKGARARVVNKVLGEFRVYAESITGQDHAGTPEISERVQKELGALRDVVRASGVKPTSGLALKLKRLVYKFNPVRRVREYLVQ